MADDSQVAKAFRWSMPQEYAPSRTVADLTKEGAALADLICPCGQGPGQAITVLRDFLTIFGPHDTLGGYLILAKQKEFREKYGCGVYHLLFCLMEHLGFSGHMGSVDSSGYLTFEGAGLKWCLEQPGFVEMAYKER